MRHTVILVVWIVLVTIANAQTATLSGKVTSTGRPVEFATVFLKGTSQAATTDSLGIFLFKHLAAGTYTLQVIGVEFIKAEKLVPIEEGNDLVVAVELATDKHILEEVVITGVTKATLIRENPVAILSISAKAIEQSNESNIIDALVKNAPGLNAVKTGPNISKPFIRGLGYNRVLTLYDGVRQEGQQWGDEHGIEVDAYNMDKAEVIKGPASLMYGSDALAGVVSLMPFMTAERDSLIHGKFTSEYQSNNGLIGNGLRLNYSSKHFFTALSGSYRIAKNYRNPFDGRVYNTGFDEKNMTALVGYRNDKGSTLISATLYDNLQGIPDGSRDSLSRQFTKQVYEGRNDTLSKRPLVSYSDLNSYALSPLHQHIQHYRTYMRHEYAIGKGQLHAMLAFQQNVRREYNHPTLPKQAGLYVRLNTVNYGLRYNFPSLATIETALGINGMWQDNKSKDATDFPIPDYRLFDAGAFLHLKWKHRLWTLGGGLRYDVRAVNWKHFHVKANPANGFDDHVSGADTVNAYLQYPEFNKTFSGVSASIGLTYKVTERISIKANVARGYRAPGITELSSNGLDPGAHIMYYGDRRFGPEFSLQEDIGLTGNFRHVTTSLSLFNNHIQHYIYLSQLTDANNEPLMDAQGNRTFQYKQASAQLYGLEAFVSIHPAQLKGFLLDNSFTCVYGYNRSSVFKGKGLDGEYLPFIPPLKFMSSLSQKFITGLKIVKAISPRVDVEWNAAQEKYLALYQTETFTPAYTLLNIGVSAEIVYSGKHSLELQAQVNNLLNQAYASNLNRLKYFEYYNASPNGRSGIYNMGRNVCVKAILNF
jgi:outer membrane receptor protein involved in Fe transport